MTEEEWRTSADPEAMCDFVRNARTHWRTRWVGWVRAQRFHVSDRRWRLLGLACCERVARRIPDAKLHDELLPLARHHAEHGSGAGERARAIEATQDWFNHLCEPRTQRTSPRWGRLCLASAIGRLFSQEPGDTEILRVTRQAAAGLEGIVNPLPGDVRATVLLRKEAEAQAALVRDVLGNPFSPEPTDPAWTANGIVLPLARTLDAEGAYHELPVLADALEDAGCTSTAILAHCRAGGEHVRGCWAVDLLLGRE